MYEETCTYDNGLTEFSEVRNVWRAAPPAAAAVDPAVLAQQAVDQMVLRGPEIGIVPKPGGVGLVGMPVYMWTARGPETYGPNTASASAGGITVTATAKVQRIVWQMGDGKTVTCTTPGTPYKPTYGKRPSPDCGHRYTQPSTAGSYHVVATSTWAIDWQATTGQSGRLTQTRQSTVDIRVGELQAVGS
ncbi:ATP/GTP-binding protein [Streptomyces litmocidini]|uniref:ATP/GTP-binding protein n=1 Tax=Streptomyces litmocidini TaxID=67318 RepID=UPI0033F1AD75